MTALKPFASLDRRTTAGLYALLLGQILLWAGVGIVYVAALVYMLAVGLPYPKVFRSWLSRLAASFLLALSVVQVAAALQFFVAPSSNFAVLSLLTTIIGGGLVWTLRKQPRQPWSLLTKVDVAGVVTALFFALPLGVLCFWQNDLTHITSMAGVQGSDGSSHFTAIAEMSKEQHLNYRTAEYYPKGFHIASAFMLAGFHANQPDQNWAANARTYASLFIAWGALVAYLVLYLAVQLTDHLRKRPPPMLLALSIGPILALLYLFTFSQEGFLSYCYICAAILLAVMYLYDAKLDKQIEQWPVVAYLLLAFGVALSWGPLLTPALLLMPALYLWPHWRKAKTPSLVLAFLIQLVPLYLHFKYARLTSQQGINATGALTAFHYGPFLAGLALTFYMLCAKADQAWQKFAGNVLLPLFILVGAFICLQYLTVGELRYYTIKTSLLLEIVLLAAAAAVLGGLVYQRKISTIHRWLIMPIIIGLGTTVLAGMTASPFAKAHTELASIAHSVRFGDPMSRHYTELGQSGKISSNITNLHYDKADGKLRGKPVATNWADLMQYNTDGTPASGLCSGKIFALQAYGNGTETEQDQLVQAVQDCIAAAADRHRPYFIVTDAASAPRLRETFGDHVTYIY
jgi:hypothetical protein